MIRLLGQFFGKARLVCNAFRGQGYGCREIGAGQAFTFQRPPYRLIGKAAGVASRNNKAANMDMVTVGMGQGRQHDLAAAFVTGRGTRMARQFLKQQQRSQLQFVELQWVLFLRHGINLI